MTRRKIRRHNDWIATSLASFCSGLKCFHGKFRRIFKLLRVRRTCQYDGGTHQVYLTLACRITRFRGYHEYVTRCGRDVKVLLRDRTSTYLNANSTFLYDRHHYTRITGMAFRLCTRPLRDSFTSATNYRHSIYSGNLSSTFLSNLVRKDRNAFIHVRRVLRFGVNNNVCNVRWDPFVIRKGVFILRFLFSNVRATGRSILPSTHNFNVHIPMVTTQDSRNSIPFMKL